MGLRLRLVVVGADQTGERVSDGFVTGQLAVVGIRRKLDMIDDVLRKRERTQRIWDRLAVEFEILAGQRPGNSVLQRLLAGLVPERQSYIIAALDTPQRVFEPQHISPVPGRKQHV